MKPFRYPGISSFDSSQKDLFKGRDADARKLYTQIMLNKTVTIHAASGTGKTSIINAAILPEIEKSGCEFLPVIIRFEGLKKTQDKNIDLNKTESALVDEIMIAIKKSVTKIPEIPYLLSKPDSIWYWAKVLQKAGKSFLFIFDQFENIESYQYAQIRYFKENLSQIFSSNTPKEFNEYFYKKSPAIAGDTEFLEDEYRRSRYNDEVSFFKSRLDSKAIFVLREDKLSILSIISDSFPEILKSEYHLLALSRKGAEEAIDLPSQMRGNFASLPFKFNTDTVTFLLDNLESKDTYRIDPFEVQIICRHVEKKVIEETKSKKLKADHETGLILIEKSYLPPINDILSNFYTECWETARKDFKGLDNVFLKCQKEIASELVVGGKRIPVYKNNFSPTALLIIPKLIESGLLRVILIDKEEFYQLCHDRMIHSLIDNLNTLTSVENIEKKLKLYGKILSNLKFDTQFNFNEKEIRNIRVFFEEVLLSNNGRTIVPYKTVTEQYPFCERVIEYAISKGLLNMIVSEDNPFLELADDDYIEPIRNAYNLRSAEEQKAEAEKNKAIAERTKQKAQQVYLLIITAIIIFAVSFVYYQQYKRTGEAEMGKKHEVTKRQKEESKRKIEEKLNKQSVYLSAANKILHSNPTLSYVIALEAYKIYNKNLKLNNLIDSLCHNYPYSINNRYFFTNELKASVLFNNKTFVFEKSEISSYDKKDDYSSTNTQNKQILGVVSRKGKVLYALVERSSLGFQIEIRDLASNLKLSQLQSQISPSTIAIADDGKIFFADGDLYKKGTLESYASIKIPAGGKDIMCAAFTHDNRFLAIGYWGGQIAIYNLKGEMVKVYQGGNYNSVVSALAITNNDKYLVSGDHANNIYIWPLGQLSNLKPIEQSNEKTIYIPIRKLVGHLNEINCIATSNDGQKLLTGSKDGTAIVWDFKGAITAVLRGHISNVDYVQFSDDDSKILTSSNNGEVILWNRGQMNNLYKNGEMANFYPFEFSELGINNLPETNNSKSLNGKAIDIINYFGELPSQNRYPEDKGYLTILTKYIKILDKEFNNILNDPKFSKLSLTKRRRLLLAYAKFIYKKPELLLTAHTESNIDRLRRNTQYYVSSIKPYLIDASSFDVVKEYLFKIINEYDQTGIQIDKSKLKFLDNACNAYLTKYKSNYQITLGVANLYQKISTIYYERNDYKTAEVFSLKTIQLYGEHSDMKNCNYYLNLTKIYLATDREPLAEIIFNKICNYEKICYDMADRNVIDNAIEKQHYTLKEISNFFLIYRVIDIFKKENQNKNTIAFEKYLTILKDHNRIFQEQNKK